jgi:NADH-quinone oxidoreductase subunit F
MARILRRIEEGVAGEGELLQLKSVASAICPFPPMGLGNTICPLGDAAALPVHSFLDKFRAEFEAHLAAKKCPYPHPWGELAEAFPA